MHIENSQLSQILLISSFAGFYLVVESLFLSQGSILGIYGIIAVIFISFLNLIPAGIFSFALVSLLPKKLVSNAEEKLMNSPSRFPVPNVAVLYTSYNDFMPEHAEYDLNEARKGGMAFYILDDSVDPSKKEEVDSFAFSNGCELIRRKVRRGFKAGAINEWILTFGKRFDYFFVLDSDSRADHRVIWYCSELARRDDKIAVVQSKTLTMTSSPTRLTRSAVTIQHAYMEIVQKAMRNLGTSPYYGHNALIKIEAIKSVGGFVEESNEDYKTLSLLHAKGYRSMYAERAISWEEVPPDYLSARKRALRWSRDAVSQLGLLKVGTPIAIGFFLFYGWVTHMSNVALIGFMPFMAWASIPHLFSDPLVEVAGSVTIAVIVLWPLLALRTKDSELTLRKMSSALLWGSVYNIPMMTPIALKIIQTTALKIWGKCRGLSGSDQRSVKEFVVTPKTKERNRGLKFFVSRMKAELIAGIALATVSAASNHLWALVFAGPQVISAICLPFLVYSESGEGHGGAGVERPLVRVSSRISVTRQLGANVLAPSIFRLNLK
jgi:hypothetical protein